MSAEIIDGRAIAATIHDEVAVVIRSMARPPTLHVVLCGDNPASETYIRNKGRVAERVGVRFTLQRLPATSSTADLLSVVEQLNRDDDVDAVLVQSPLPAHIDTDAVVHKLDPTKDADGFHPCNLGVLAEGGVPLAVPCTPAGCVEMLRRYDIPIRGRRAVVIGRSRIVGRPLALLLINADATVTVCHSRTPDLPLVAREADILVAAVGRPEMVDASYVKPGACVIDVGINPRDGRVVGDVDRRSVEQVAGWLTPVPGGVGPMTIAMLMRNTTLLAQRHRDTPPR